MLGLPPQAYRPPIEEGAPRRLPVSVGCTRWARRASIDDPHGPGSG